MTNKLSHITARFRSLAFSSLASQAPVLGLLIACTAMSFSYVLLYASDFPLLDDLWVVERFKPHALPAFFTPLFDYYAPIHIAGYYASWILADGSVKPLCIAFTCLMTASCWLCTLASYRRTRTLSAADVIYPLALIGTPQLQNSIYAVLWTGALAVALSAIAIVVLTTPAARLTAKALTCAAVSLIALSAIGGVGLVMSLSLLPALFSAAMLCKRSLRMDWRSIGLPLATAGAGVGTLTFFHLFSLRRESVSSGTLMAKLGTAAEAFSTLVGGAGQPFWPVSFLLCAALLLMSGIAAIATTRRSEGSPHPDYRLPLLLLCPVAVACSIGLTRGWQGGFQPHYSLYMSPGWLIVAIVLKRSARMPLGVATLCVALITLAFVNGIDFRPAIAMGRARSLASLVLMNDIDKRLPVEVIAAKNSPYWRFAEIDVFERQLRAMASFGRGRFAKMDLSKEIIWRDASTSYAEIFQAQNTEDGLHITGDSQLLFHVDGAPVDVVRIEFEMVTADNSAKAAIMPRLTGAHSWRFPDKTRSNIGLWPPWDFTSCRQAVAMACFDEPTDSFIVSPHDRPAILRIKSVKVGRLPK